MASNTIRRDMEEVIKYNIGQCNRKSVKDIARIVAAHLGINLSMLYHPSKREQFISNTRHIIWWICYQDNHTKAHIARHFNRNHSTVRHGIKKVFENQIYNKEYLLQSKKLYELVFPEDRQTAQVVNNRTADKSILRQMYYKVAHGKQQNQTMRGQ